MDARAVLPLLVQRRRESTWVAHFPVIQETMKDVNYLALVDSLCIPGSPVQWRTCLELLPSLTLGNRKGLAMLARAQCIPDKDTQLHVLVSRLLPPSLIPIFSTLYDSSFTAGLLMTMVRLAPLPQDQINSAYESAILKERKVMDETGLPSTLNYNVFFGRPDECIVPGVDANPVMAKRVQRSIDTWIQQIANKLFFPRMSHKSIEKSSSNVTRSILEYEGIDYENEIMSQVELERVYHQTGYQVQGPCEMRQRWYTSQLSPRTYFASGGTAYHNSKFIADMMVQLCDNLPCTNRRYRVNPTRLRIADGSHAYIYDLSSFTSNLHEQRYFVDRLAEYCEGVQVYIVDSWRGVMQVDLSDLIQQYNSQNVQAPYTITAATKKDTDPILYHCTAGFLGVYGNIANATFLHGIVMLQLCDSDDQLNVAGDDGIMNSDNDEEAFELLRHLGLMEMSKSFTTTQDGAIHLKRPIYQVGNQLIQGTLTLWPSFEYLIQNDNDIDPRYPIINRMTLRERRDALASSITGFLTSLSSITLDNWAIDVVDSVLTYAYAVMQLPIDGYVPQVQGNTYGFIPQYQRRFVGLEPKRNTINRIYQGIAKVPYRGKLDVQEEGYVLNETFMANSTPMLRYVERLGYVEKRNVQIVVYGEIGLDMLLKEYFDPEPAVYEYSVVQAIPQWILDSQECIRHAV